VSGIFHALPGCGPRCSGPAFPKLRPSSRSIPTLTLLTALCFQARADEYIDWVTALYRPYQGEQVALAPDGQHVAYTRHGRDGLYLVLMNLDAPERRAVLHVANDRLMKYGQGRAPSKLQFLQWATPNRIVFVPTEEKVGSKRITPIYVANADGTGAKQLASAADFSDQLVMPTRESGLSKQSTDDTETVVDAEKEITGSKTPTRRQRRITGDADMESNRGDRAAEPPPEDGDEGGDLGSNGATLEMDPDDHTPDIRHVMRPIRILGLLAADRQQLFVEALGERPVRSTANPPPPLADTAVFRMDLDSGKMTQVATETNEGEFFYDRNGEPRLLYTQSIYEETRTYRYRLGQSLGWREVTRDWPEFPVRALKLSPDNYFGEHAYPLGIGFDSNVVYIASNVGRDTYAIESFNLRTRVRAVVAQHPLFDLAPLDPAESDDTLVFDQPRQRLVGVRTRGFTSQTVWIDPEMADAQRLIESKLPNRTAEILEWSDNRTRFLVRATSAGEPGRYYVFDRSENLLFDFLRRAPWLRPADLHAGRPFSFDTAAGVHLTGFLTYPRRPRIDPTPLIVYFPSGFPGQLPTEFDREAQALAEMGVLVVRVNLRGSGGQGLKHRNAINAGIDTVPIEDVQAAVEWVIAHHKIDRKRIATVGEGFGGYLALRAVELKPAIFRCAVAINAPCDLEAWLRVWLTDDDSIDFKQRVRLAFFRKSAVPLSELSVIRQADRLTRPVLLMVNPEPGDRDEITRQNDQFRRVLQRMGRTVEFAEIGKDFERGLPAARAKAFRQIEEFFNLNLYNYKVDVGQSKEVN
jgi:dipeptidyl aminopeptidase/acylaminoacyl peptidase